MRQLLLICALFLSSFAFAQNNYKIITEQGKQYILHTVQPKETLYRISKTYGAGISEIIQLNPGVSGTDIKIGQDLKIPYRAAFVVDDGTLVDKNIVENTSNTKQKADPIASKREEKKVEKKEVAGKGIDSTKLLKGKTNSAVAEKVKEVEPVVKEEVAKQSSEIAQVEEKKEKVEETKELVDELPAGLDKNAETHIVKAGETLFRISKWYNISVPNLVAYNNLKSTDLSVGQVVKLKAPKVAVKEDVVAEVTEKVIEEPKGRERVREVRGEDGTKGSKPGAKTTEEEAGTIRMTRYASKYMQLEQDDKYEVTESEQVISFINDNRKPNQAGWYAIHKSLPIGTYIKIVNPINGAIAFAKVIQNLPESPENNGVDIKLPLAAAQSDLKLFDEVTRVKVFVVSKIAQ